jgi:hypothetical protein
MVGAMTAYMVFPKNDRRAELVFRGCIGVEVESSWRNLTDTAKIVLPRRYRYRYENIKNKIQRADRVLIQLGYLNNNKTVFKGFVTSVDNETPTTIACEDNMFLMKQITINKLYRGVTLNELVRDIVPIEYEIETPDMHLGNFDANEMTVAEVLDRIKEQTGLYSYFKGDKLVVGKIYTDDVDITKTLTFNHDIIESDLKYAYDNDKVLVEAQSVTNGKKITATAGKKGGRTVKIKLKGANLATLQNLANEKLKHLIKDGWDGSVTTFGSPFFEHGYKLQIVDNEFDRSGVYYIDSVRTSFGDGGFRRTLEIGRAVKQAEN